MEYLSLGGNRAGGDGAGGIRWIDKSNTAHAARRGYASIYVQIIYIMSHQTVSSRNLEHL